LGIGRRSQIGRTEVGRRVAFQSFCDDKSRNIVGGLEAQPRWPQNTGVAWAIFKQRLKRHSFIPTRTTPTWPIKHCRKCAVRSDF
jgi:hypothetical protein